MLILIFNYPIILIASVIVDDDIQPIRTSQDIDLYKDGVETKIQTNISFWELIKMIFTYFIIIAIIFVIYQIISTLFFSKNKNLDVSTTPDAKLVNRKSQSIKYKKEEGEPKKQKTPQKIQTKATKNSSKINIPKTIQKKGTNLTPKIDLPNPIDKKIEDFNKYMKDNSDMFSKCFKNIVNTQDEKMNTVNIEIDIKDVLSICTSLDKLIEYLKDLKQNISFYNKTQIANINLSGIQNIFNVPNDLRGYIEVSISKDDLSDKNGKILQSIDSNNIDRKPFGLIYGAGRDSGLSGNIDMSLSNITSDIQRGQQIDIENFQNTLDYIIKEILKLRNNAKQVVYNIITLKNK